MIPLTKFTAHQNHVSKCFGRVANGFDLFSNCFVVVVVIVVVVATVVVVVVVVIVVVIVVITEGIGESK